MSVNLAVIGTGVVGAAFLNQLAGLKSAIQYNVILIARSKKSVISADYSPIDLSNWKSVTESASQDNLSTDELVAFLKKSPAPVILVDNTSDAQIADSYQKLVANGISIATPNKKAFSSSLDSWKQLFDASSQKGSGLVYHEATVGAGLPIIGTLNDMISTGDEVEKIEGIFSGTLSYIFNEYCAKDAKFSEIVSIAKQLGYTEPDPRDDLNGLDVARKVTILARLSGASVESPTSFPVQSLIPKALESVESASEFMEKLPNHDDELQALKDEAAAENKVLRFVGKVDLPNNVVSVGVEKYDVSHPFASLKGSDNVISIKTKRYQNPLIVQGAGAGADVTAAGVLADTIKIAQRLV
ncbi:CYFA0S37e00298g1_1 [Cyberlindnera fabianii]|uniref:Homoserine dehydrogenase n=1 Tax=Cyberlindnera fabianii TaxID=36022 RepID=A0A061BCQ6_CYBFA|nr:CYFA0S37e00298g1_1 [Cyberlindnera fabianii]